MNLPELIKTTEQKMLKSIESLKSSLGKIRTGRAHVGILDHLQVDYYGSMVPISQVANVTLIDARTIGVSPWEKKMAQAIDKAIRESDLGLNPTSVGDLLRVPMPPLSEERRRELAKVVKGEGEHAKVAIRNLRRDANNALKEQLKAKSISEDEERRTQESVQKMTDRFIVDVDKMLADKEKEIMTV
jgi:ribosome recycling factor